MRRRATTSGPLLLGMLWLAAAAAPAPSVTDTSYLTASGERVLRIECVIPVARAEAWKLFSTEEGLKRWVAPIVRLDLRVGGTLRTNYDRAKAIGDPGTIELKVINYLEGELLTLKVALNDSFPAEVRAADGNLQELIELRDTGDGQTRIVSSMIGWGQGPAWDETYAFFARGNAWTYRQITALYPRG